MARRFTVEAVFKGIDKMTAPINKMQNRVGKFSRGFSRGLKGIDGGVDKVLGGLKKTAIATGAVLAIVTAGLTDVVTVGAKFEATTSAALARFDVSVTKRTETLDKLTAAAVEWGKKTKFSATQAAEALDFMARAGFGVDSAIASLPGVIDLATAAGTDLAEATDMASDALGAYGVNSKDPIKALEALSMVNDILAKSTNSANVDIEGLFETIRDSAPIAMTAGASIAEYNALVGIMAGSSIKGTKGATALKNAYTRLVDPPAAAAKALKRLRVETEDSNGNMKDMASIVDQINKGLAGMGGVQRTATISQLFGARAIAGMTAVLSAGGEEIRRYTKYLKESNGAAGDMASIMKNNVQGSLDSLTSSIEALKIRIFLMNKGPLRDAIDATTEWVRANEGLIATRVGEWVAHIVKNFKNYITWGKRLFIVVGAFLALAAVLKTIIALMTVINFLTTANPIVLWTLGIVAAIAVLIPVVMALIKHWDTIKTAFIGFMMTVSDGFESLPIWAKAAFFLLTGPITKIALLAAVVIKHWEPLKDYFKGLWEDIITIFDFALEKIMPIINKITSATKKVGSMAGKVAGFFEGGDTLTKIEGTIGAGVVSPQEQLARVVDEVITTSRAEVTINDRTGTATADRELPAGVTLASSGAF
ncbi:MAG: phage tail tape measure protein [Shimia sp.]|nr:phage tail tape measure protein [Shimia sp.]